eukprot:1419382-Pleurochrysis_carterae.AAC.1
MADRFLPNKTLRKPTTTPAWFTDKAQRTSPYTKFLASTNESDSAMKQGKPYLEFVTSILCASTTSRPNIAHHTSMLCALCTTCQLTAVRAPRSCSTTFAPPRTRLSCLAARASLCRASTPCATLVSKGDQPQ